MKRAFVWYGRKEIEAAPCRGRGGLWQHCVDQLRELGIRRAVVQVARLFRATGSQRISLLDQSFKLFSLLGDPVRVSGFILGA